MSQSNSLIYKFVNKLDSITINNIINSFVSHDWKCIENEVVRVLPLGDNDDFEWQSLKLDRFEIESLIKLKYEAHETIGIQFTKNILSFGCVALFLAENANEILLDLDCFKKETHNGIIDLTWYLDEFNKIFRSTSLYIESIEYKYCH